METLKLFVGIIAACAAFFALFMVSLTGISSFLAWDFNILYDVFWVAIRVGVSIGVVIGFFASIYVWAEDVK